MAASLPPQVMTFIIEQRDITSVGSEGWSVLNTPRHPLNIEINWLDKLDRRAARADIKIEDNDVPAAHTDIAVLVRWAGLAPRLPQTARGPIPVSVKRCDLRAASTGEWHRVPEGAVLLFWVNYITDGPNTWYKIQWANEAIQNLQGREDKFKIAKHCEESTKILKFIRLRKLAPENIDQSVVNAQPGNISQSVVNAQPRNIGQPLVNLQLGKKAEVDYLLQRIDRVAKKSESYGQGHRGIYSGNTSDTGDTITVSHPTDTVTDSRQFPPPTST